MNIRNPFRADEITLVLIAVAIVLFTMTITQGLWAENQGSQKEYCNCILDDDE